jgi:hypothetical protein
VLISRSFVLVVFFVFFFGFSFPGSGFSAALKTRLSMKPKKRWLENYMVAVKQAGCEDRVTGILDG